MYISLNNITFRKIGMSELAGTVVEFKRIDVDILRLPSLFEIVPSGQIVDSTKKHIIDSRIRIEPPKYEVSTSKHKKYATLTKEEINERFDDFLTSCEGSKNVTEDQNNNLKSITLNVDFETEKCSEGTLPIVTKFVSDNMSSVNKVVFEVETIGKFYLT